MDILFNLLILGLVFIGLAQPVQAYLDPGSGSFLFQIIVGALLSATFAIKLYFRKIKSWFKKSPKPSINDEQK